MSFGTFSNGTKGNVVWRVASSINYSKSKKPEYNDHDLPIQNKIKKNCIKRFFYRHTNKSVGAKVFIKFMNFIVTLPIFKLIAKFIFRKKSYFCVIFHEMFYG